MIQSTNVPGFTRSEKRELNCKIRIECSAKRVKCTRRQANMLIAAVESVYKGSHRFADADLGRWHIFPPEVCTKLGRVLPVVIVPQLTNPDQGTAHAMMNRLCRGKGEIGFQCKLSKGSTKVQLRVFTGGDVSNSCSPVMAAIKA